MRTFALLKKLFKRLLAGTFWWIVEKRLGENRQDVIKKLYNQMSYSFMELLLTAKNRNLNKIHKNSFAYVYFDQIFQKSFCYSLKGSKNNRMLNRIGDILAQSVWLSLWFHYPYMRAQTTRPAFLTGMI